MDPNKIFELEDHSLLVVISLSLLGGLGLLNPGTNLFMKFLDFIHSLTCLHSVHHPWALPQGPRGLEDPPYIANLKTGETGGPVRSLVICKPRVGKE